MGLSIDPRLCKAPFRCHAGVTHRCGRLAGHVTGHCCDKCDTRWSDADAEVIQTHKLEALKRLAADWHYSDELVGAAFRRWVRDEAS